MSNLARELVDPASASLIAGDVVCVSKTAGGLRAVTKGVSAALTTARGARGIVVASTAAPSAYTSVAVNGARIDPVITGLAPYDHPTPVRVNELARCQRVTGALSATDVLVGTADALGWLDVDVRAPALPSLADQARIDAAALAAGQPIQVGSATLKLALLPQSIVADSSGLVYQWDDRSGYGYHAVPTNGPIVDSTTVAGLTGVKFDGTNDRLDGGIAITADRPMTVFLLYKTVVDNGGGTAFVLDMSDNGSADRSVQIERLFTNVAVRDESGDNGQASYVNSPATAFLLHRFDVDLQGRAIYENGNWKAGSARGNTTVRSPTTYRLGDRITGGFPWNGIIFALCVYEGAMSEADKKRVEAALLSVAKLGQPYQWPLPRASTTAGDPRLILPPANLAIHALTGRQIEIWKDAVHYRDGASYDQTITTALPLDESRDDRWALTPTAAGDYNVRIDEGAYNATARITVRDMLAGGAPNKKILCVGDSNTNRGGSGWIEIIGEELGARVTFVGTKGPNAGMQFKHEGIDGATWVSFDTAGSPFFNGGGSLNIAGYRALLAADPDIIVWRLGQNDVYNQTDGTIEGVITTAFSHAETLIAAWTAALPSVKHLIVLSAPLARSALLWTSNWGTFANQQKKNLHRLAERGYTQFAGREGSRIFVAARPFFSIDPIDGYVEHIHHNSYPGHKQEAAAILPALVAIWT